MEDKMAEEQTPLFVNVTRMDRELYFEAVRARGKNGRTLVLTAGGLTAALIGLFLAGRWIAVLGLLIAAGAVLSPALVGRRDFQRLCRRHPGGVWEKTVRFFPDHLESDAGCGVTTAPYSALRREYESEHMYILDFGRTCPAAAVAKDGFVTGSMEELRDFITQVRCAAYAPEENVD